MLSRMLREARSHLGAQIGASFAEPWSKQKMGNVPGQYVGRLESEIVVASSGVLEASVGAEKCHNFDVYVHYLG